MNGKHVAVPNVDANVVSVSYAGSQIFQHMHRHPIQSFYMYVACYPILRKAAYSVSANLGRRPLSACGPRMR